MYVDVWLWHYVQIITQKIENFLSIGTQRWQLLHSSNIYKGWIMSCRSEYFFFDLIDNFWHIFPILETGFLRNTLHTVWVILSLPSHREFVVSWKRERERDIDWSHNIIDIKTKSAMSPKCKGYICCHSSRISSLLYTPGSSLNIFKIFIDYKYRRISTL